MNTSNIIRILHQCEVRIENSIWRVKVWHHEALPSDAKHWSRGMEFSISTNHWCWILFLAYLLILNIYTPSIYAEGYIVFVFPFVHTSVPFVELLQSFTCKQLEWSISHQSLIRKHSYLYNRYPGGSAFIPWLPTPGSMPWGGARGQFLGHL